MWLNCECRILTRFAQSVKGRDIPIIPLTLAFGFLVALAMELDPRKKEGWRDWFRYVVWAWFIILAVNLNGAAQPKQRTVPMTETLVLREDEDAYTSTQVDPGVTYRISSNNPVMLVARLPDGSRKEYTAPAGQSTWVGALPRGPFHMRGYIWDTRVTVAYDKQETQPGEDFIVLLAKLIWWGGLGAGMAVAGYFEGAAILWLQAKHFGGAEGVIMERQREREYREKKGTLLNREQDVDSKINSIQSRFAGEISRELPDNIMEYEGYVAEIWKRWKLHEITRTGKEAAEAMAQLKALLAEKASIVRAKMELDQTYWEYAHHEDKLKMMDKDFEHQRTVQEAKHQEETARLEKEKIEAQLAAFKARRELEDLKQSNEERKRLTPEEKAEAQAREEQALRKILKERLATRAQLERVIEEEYKKLLDEGWSEERAKEITDQMRRDLWKALGG